MRTTTTKKKKKQMMTKKMILKQKITRSMCLLSLPSLHPLHHPLLPLLIVVKKENLLAVFHNPAMMRNLIKMIARSILKMKVTKTRG